MGQIMMPEKKQDTSIGRRLFSMAAPVVGGMIGGPVGAAAGGMLGSKMSGGSTQDAVLGGIQAGVGQAQSDGADAAQKAMIQSNNSLSKRLDALRANPAVAVNDGLEVLKSLPESNPLRQEYAPALIKAQMMSSRKFGVG